MTSRSSTTFSALLKATNDALTGRGYDFNRSTMSERHFLATALTALRGSPASELNMGLPQLLAGVANAIDSGSRSANSLGVADLLAACVDTIGPYVAPAVNFDGSTYLDCASLSTTDSRYASFSMWLKPSSTADYQIIGVTDPTAAYSTWLYYAGTGQVVAMGIATADGSRSYEVQSPGGSTPPGSWFHVIGCLDTVTETAKFYINDSAVVLTATGSNSAPFPAASWNGLPYRVGNDGGSPYTGDIADLWIAPNVNLMDGNGDIPVATRRQFISSGGKPVNPASFPQSAILLHGTASTFAINRGTGGSFTVHGALSNAVSGPSS